MSANFGAAALRHAGLAARVLGWRPAEFWSATPAELATSLGLTADSGSATMMSRFDLQRMMEHDDERPG
ncbi:MAG: phage tail assembly chaperone [Novosphingobium sp.]